jgi:hypothetical protein
VPHRIDGGGRAFGDDAAEMHGVAGAAAGAVLHREAGAAHEAVDAAVEALGGSPVTRR